MKKAQLVATAAAVALSATAVTTAATTASAATTYKVKSGKLVNAKTGKVVPGTKKFNNILYKDGKKFTGDYNKVYYYKGKPYTGVSSKSKLYKNQYVKNGKPATADFKKVYYYKGKPYTGVASKSTLYKGQYLVKGKPGTGDYKNVYYYKGNAYTGVSSKSTLYKGQYVENGKPATGEYKGVYYINGVKDAEKPVIAGENVTLAYGAEYVEPKTTVTDNSGKEIEAKLAKITFNGEEVKTVDTKIAGVYTLTYTAADANGNEADAKEITVTVGENEKAEVESVEFVNAVTLKINFSKAVDEKAAKTAGVVEIEDVTLRNPQLSEDGKTLTLTADKAFKLEAAKLTVDEVMLKGSDKEKTSKYASLVNYEDKVAPTALVASSEIGKISEKTTKTVTVKFSEPVQNSAIATINGTTASVSTGKDNTELVLTASKELKAGDVVEVKLTNVKDMAGNAIEPNPTTISTTVSAADAVAPTISSVETKGSDKVVVTYSEDVDQASVTENAYLSMAGKQVAKLIAGEVDETNKNEVTYTVASISEEAKFENLFTEKTPSVSATLFIPAKSVKDIAGNELANDYTTTVNFTKDYTAPTLVSSQFVDNKLVLTFSEEVQKDNSAKLSLAATNLVTGKTDGAVEFDLDDTNTKISDDKKVVTIDLSSKASTEAELTYIVSYAEGTFKDLNALAAKEYKETVTLSKKVVEQSADKEAPLIEMAGDFVTLQGKGTDTGKSLYNTDKDATDYKLSYKVSDDNALDFASIRNTNNYTFAGQALPAGSTITTDAKTADEKETTVTITVPKKSVTQNMEGVLAISGIKDIAGNTIQGIVTTDSVNKETLAEGIAPTIVSATAVQTKGSVAANLTDGIVFTLEPNSQTSLINILFDEEVVLAAGVKAYVQIGKSSNYVEYGTVALSKDGQTVTITPLDANFGTMSEEDATFVLATDVADESTIIKSIQDKNENALEIPAISVKAAK